MASPPGEGRPRRLASDRSLAMIRAHMAAESEEEDPDETLSREEQTARDALVGAVLRRTGVRLSPGWRVRWVTDPPHASEPGRRRKRFISPEGKSHNSLDRVVNDVLRIQRAREGGDGPRSPAPKPPEPLLASTRSRAHPPTSHDTVDALVARAVHSVAGGMTAASAGATPPAPSRPRATPPRASPARPRLLGDPDAAFLAAGDALLALASAGDGDGDTTPTTNPRARITTNDPSRRFAREPSHEPSRRPRAYGGAYPSACGEKWVAEIRVDDGRRFHVGVFARATDADRAWRVALTELAARQARRAREREEREREEGAFEGRSAEGAAVHVASPSPSPSPSPSSEPRHRPRPWETMGLAEASARRAEKRRRAREMCEANAARETAARRVERRLREETEARAARDAEETRRECEAVLARAILSAARAESAASRALEARRKADEARAERARECVEHVERFLAERGGAVDARAMARASGGAFTTADVTRAIADVCARDEGGKTTTRVYVVRGVG